MFGQRANDGDERYAGSTNLRRAQAVADAAAAIPTTTPVAGVTVIVLNLDRPDLVGGLLDALARAPAMFAERGLRFQLVVGDTGSTDPEVLRHYAQAPPWLTVVRGLRYHFSAANNACFRAVEPTDRVLLLNNDVLLRDPAPLVAMAAALDVDPRLGVVGLALDFPDGRAQHLGVDFFRGGRFHALPFHEGAAVPTRHFPGASWPAIAVTGACLMIRYGLWQALGGLDEAYERECQDIDLCLAARRLGATVAVIDAGPVVHLEGATRRIGDLSTADRRLFLRRWRSWLEAQVL